MRSKTAKARKAWQQANKIQVYNYATGCYDWSNSPAPNFSIPPRYKLLQSIAGTYNCPVKRGESPVSFVISTDPRRILRIGDSRHFSSCLDFKHGSNKQYIPDYLKNRYCAVAGVLNSKTGEWLSRVMIHVCLDEQAGNKEVLVLETIYGDNFPLKHFVQQMFELYGLDVHLSEDAELPIEYEWATLDGTQDQWGYNNYHSKFEKSESKSLRTLSRYSGYYFTPFIENKYYSGSWPIEKRTRGYYVHARRLTYIKIEHIDDIE